MRVGLVPDIPHDPVVGRVEHVMQRHRQLDHAEPRPEVTARHRHRVDHLLTHSVRHRLKLALGKRAKSRRLVKPVEDRGFYP